MHLGFSFMFDQETKILLYIELLSGSCNAIHCLGLTQSHSVSLHKIFGWNEAERAGRTLALPSSLQNVFNISQIVSITKR